MASHLPEIGYDGFPALSHARETANATPFLENILIRVSHQTNAVALMFKTQVVAGLNPKGPANLDRDGNLAFARNFGSRKLRLCGFCRQGHGPTLLTFSSILLTFWFIKV
jgi:hypothetical protein